ncbi:hypothetical protein E5288_WYG002147 [Bos mutus]|uniref:Uncharacterized protein n=1 Tax=Bos mutus TaxID=72004 RepID=A0A6B0S437_9CETA|nr:hypothetical protein [Bos mutus]
MQTRKMPLSSWNEEIVKRTDCSVLNASKYCIHERGLSPDNSPKTRRKEEAKAPENCSEWLSTGMRPAFLSCDDWPRKEDLPGLSTGAQLARPGAVTVRSCHEAKDFQEMEVHKGRIVVEFLLIEE